MLRDPKVARFGAETLAELASADQGPQLADLRRGRPASTRMNGDAFLADADPFALFDADGRRRPRRTPSTWATS